jgi:hypothetical protein
MYKM